MFLFFFLGVTSGIAADKPNILVIFGDDIGMYNISAYHRGMMGGRTPNIDRIAAVPPDFNKSIFIDFAGAKITSDAGFLMMREVDQRFDIIQSGCKLLKDTRSVSHKKHSFEQMIRQRVYKIAAGYEDCNGAVLLRIDPALRLALDKGHQSGAGQSVMSRLENEMLGTATGQKALDAIIISGDHDCNCLHVLATVKRHAIFLEGVQLSVPRRQVHLS